MENEKWCIVNHSKQNIFFLICSFFWKVGLRSGFLEPHNFNFETLVAELKKKGFLRVTEDFHYAKNLGGCTNTYWAITLGWNGNVFPLAYLFPLLSVSLVRYPSPTPSQEHRAPLATSLDWYLNMACMYTCSAWLMVLSWCLEGNYSESTLKFQMKFWGWSVTSVILLLIYQFPTFFSNCPCVHYHILRWNRPEWRFSQLCASLPVL